jgi:hypothetical protein
VTYLLLFLGQALNFLMIVINIRACAKSKILMAMATDFLICVLSFGLFRLIAQAHTWREMLAYALGGACGSALAIKVTRKWDAQ